MWPAASTSKTFGNKACPSGAACQLPNCIFSHEAPKSPPALYSPTRSFTATEDEPNPKSKGFELGDHDQKEPVEDATRPVAPKPSIFVGFSLSKNKALTEKLTSNQATLPKSALSPVSPLLAAATGPKSVTQPDASVSLTPRKVRNEPAPFTRRLVLLKELHRHMALHNDKLLRARKSEVKALHLTDDQLKKLAVDEEQKVAIDNPSVYENILKQRIVKLRNMPIEEWVKEREEADAKAKGLPPKKPPPKRVDTGLTPKQELSLLPILECPQDGLDAHGYVTEQPTEAELTDARLLLEEAENWEKCERCTTRFQVFPDRREEDGALTSGGECRYHWGRRVFPKRSKHAAREPTTLSCCNAVVDSPGCTAAETHVFKVNGANRLSLAMPFIKTPENNEAPKNSAVCFDCEMAYTTYGLEMLRLTVISWPTHKPIVDVLVKPLGHILDLNTRFSGVTLEQFSNAKPFDPHNPKPIRHDLRIVESPYAARDLFLAHVSPGTPVLGHALENDLNTLRLIHPFIIDTVLLFPTNQGLPFRHGLRTLAKKYLDEDIQQGGAAGHDSFEDSKTTGELVRVKIKEKWKSLKSEGWTVRDDGVYPPMPKGPLPSQAPPTVPTVPSMVPVVNMAVLQGKPAEKRKLSRDEEELDEDEPLAKK